MEQEKTFVAAVLQVLDEHHIQASKVLLHKFIYFLDTQGVKTGFRFEPYTYGPYSFGLASTLGSMDFWDEIKENREKVSIVDLQKYAVDDSLKRTLKDKLSLFQNIVGDFSFSNLERIGTLLYCAQVLTNYGEELTESSLKEEFKAWKKNRYQDAEIHDAYEKLKPYLSNAPH